MCCSLALCQIRPPWWIFAESSRHLLRHSHLCCAGNKEVDWAYWCSNLFNYEWWLSRWRRDSLPCDSVRARSLSGWEIDRYASRRSLRRLEDIHTPSIARGGSVFRRRVSSSALYVLPLSVIWSALALASCGDGVSALSIGGVCWEILSCPIISEDTQKIWNRLVHSL